MGRALLGAAQKIMTREEYKSRTYIKVEFSDAVQIYRQCTKCVTAHELSVGYHRDKVKRCGYRPVCRSCESSSGTIRSHEEYASDRTYLMVDYEQVVQVYRKCSKCGEAHELSAGYSRDKNKRYGHRTVCKSCQATAHAAWREANPDKVASNNANRRAAKLQRTPFWVTRAHKREMATRYTEAQKLKEVSGVAYHVDHIVPMQCGIIVSGLHVPWNLQVITATENLQKGNKFTLWDED